VIAGSGFLLKHTVKSYRPIKNLSCPSSFLIGRASRKFLGQKNQNSGYPSAFGRITGKTKLRKLKEE
jgi:hypothetical protein